MIRDAENTFWWKKDLAGTATAGIYSDVLEIGKGNAVTEPWLDISLNAPLVGGDVAITLQTAADEAFATPVDLASATVKTASPAGKVMQLHLPHGNLGYLRLKLAPTAALTAGTITAAILIDATLQ